jgi:hypothetical protein
MAAFALTPYPAGIIRGPYVLRGLLDILLAPKLYMHFIFSNVYVAPPHMLSFGLASIRATTAHCLRRLQLAQVSPSLVSPRPSVLTSDATGWSHACIECWASRARSTKSINCCPRLHSWLDQWAVSFFLLSLSRSNMPSNTRTYNSI